MSYMRKENISRKLKAIKLFKKWKEKAKPLLVEILSKNKEKIIGLEFNTEVPNCSFAYTSGTNINRIVVDDKRDYRIESRDSDYQDSRKVIETIYTPENLADMMLRGLEREDILYIPINARRNRLIRDIENLTGINIKR